jgi:hypothetical protein
MISALTEKGEPMYRSPIDIVYQNLGVDVGKKLDSDIYTAILKCDINVDKEELIRALKYDRDQYNKGYMDGRADAKKEIVQCKDCRHCEKWAKWNGGKYFACMRIPGEVHDVDPFHFCSYGEKRCDNEVD